MSKTNETNGKVNLTELPPEVQALLPKPGNKIEIDPQAVKEWASHHRYPLLGVLGLALLAGWYFCWPKSTPTFPPGTTTVHAGGTGFQFAGFPQPAGGATQFGAPAAAPPAVAFGKSPNAKLADAATMSFTVASVGGIGNSKFLNSTADYRSPANQSICLMDAAAAAVHPPSLIGKTITATGQLKQSAKTGGTYLLVTQPSGISVK
jgi:hypothetical protein